MRIGLQPGVRLARGKTVKIGVKKAGEYPISVSRNFFENSIIIKLNSLMENHRNMNLH